MSILFEKGRIGAMELSNRFVRSATWEGLASDDGSVTPRLIEMLTQLAEGGVGLIIPGHAYVLSEGKAGPWQLGIHEDERIAGLSELTRAVHAQDAKIVVQLAHSGFFAMEQITGKPPMVVSAIDGFTPPAALEITPDYIRTLTAAFADAARRAQLAGFDGVQIHSAHGYLLSQFLSPIYNRRKDEYGGRVENRCRIHREIVRSIRKMVGDDFPLLIKINGQDYAQDGLTLADSVRAAKILAENGLDAIEVSGGLLSGGKLSPSRTAITTADREAYFEEDAGSFKKEIDIPLILVGGIRSFDTAERLVNDGTADFISMSRPFICEPDLIRRWQSGDRKTTFCVSDNKCFSPGFNGEGISCVTRQRLKK